MCQETGDDWANTVQVRILHVHDLYAADAVYHRVCSANFRTMKPIPAIYENDESSVKKVKVGRPQEKQRADAFLEVTKFLEENEFLFRICMEEILADTEHSAYSYPHMQKEHFGNKIIER